MRVTAKGQVTIPIEIRRRLGIVPETEVEFDVVGDEIKVCKTAGWQPACLTGRRSRLPLRHAGQRRGRGLVSRLRERGAVQMTTQEILALTRGEE